MSLLRRSLVLCISLGLTACLVETPEANLEGQDVRLTFIHTSDLHSRFFPYKYAPGLIDRGLGLLPRSGQTTALVGGIARIATVSNCIRGINRGPECKELEPIIGPPAARVMHVDSGDIFQGAPVYNLFNGEVEMRAMSQLGLTAMVIGNHEFDKGGPQLALMKENFGGFPLLAANYQFGDPRDETQNKLRNSVGPYFIANAGGVTVGVIGMANLSSIQGIIEGGNSLGIRPLETKKTIEDMVSVLRSQVDVLTVVSHLGLEEDEDVAVREAEDRDENQQVALEAVDVIFGGHLHIVLNPPKDIPHLDEQDQHQTGHTVLCHSGAFAKYIGRIDLVVHMPTAAEKAAGERARVKSYGYRVIPIDDRIPEDAAMVEMLEPYQLKMNQFLNLTQLFGVVPCATNAGTCPKLARNSAEGGDSQLGNMVAASMRFRRRVEADFSLTNSLGIRADFESGPLDLEQMYNVFPFENTIATMFLSGNEVQQMLDFVAARSSERGCRSQVQVSGIYFDMVCGNDDMECNTRRAEQGLGPGPCAKNIHLGDDCRNAENSFVGTTCQPLDEFAEYRVAVNDYIANGGSGFSVLKRNTTKFNTGISLRDSLIDFIRTLPNRCLQSDYRNLIGQECRSTTGERYDCTEACAAGLPECLNPEAYDYSGLPCLDPTVEAPDGRILPIEGSGM